MNAARGELRAIERNSPDTIAVPGLASACRRAATFTAVADQIIGDRHDHIADMRADSDRRLAARTLVEQIVDAGERGAGLREIPA